MKLRALVPFALALSGFLFAHDVNIEGVSEIIVQNNLNVTLEKAKSHRHSHIPQTVTYERVGDKLILKSSSADLQKVRLYASDNFRRLRQLTARIQRQLSIANPNPSIKGNVESSGSLMLDHVKGVSEIVNHGEGASRSLLAGPANHQCCCQQR